MQYPKSGCILLSDLLVAELEHVMLVVSIIPRFFLSVWSHSYTVPIPYATKRCEELI